VGHSKAYFSYYWPGMYRRPSVKLQEECQGTHSTGVITAKIQPVLVCAWKMWEHKRTQNWVKAEKTNFYEERLRRRVQLSAEHVEEDGIIVRMETELVMPGDMQLCWHWTNKIQKLAPKLRKFSLKTLKQNPFS